MQPPRPIDSSDLPTVGELVHMERLVDVRTLVRMSGMAERTIWRMVRAGAFPAPLHVGRLARWRAREYNRWVEQEAAKRVTLGGPRWQSCES
jgi:predicted DNA-binding transcriptional regulator AlpA